MPWEELAFGIVILGVFTGLGALAFSLVRLLRRGNQPAVADTALREALERLEERSAQLSAGMQSLVDLDHRMMDLEERVDFAERVLAQHSAPSRLPGTGEAS